jgi:hypothetical protein
MIWELIVVDNQKKKKKVCTCCLLESMLIKPTNTEVVSSCIMEINQTGRQAYYSTSTIQHEQTENLDIYLTRKGSQIDHQNIFGTCHTTN